MAPPALVIAGCALSWPAAAGAAVAAYILAMLVYRCCIETKRVVPCPPAKGWTAHEADVAAVRAAFAGYLAGRAPGEKVTIQRTKGGHADSNRTLAADYKREARKVDVSALDAVIQVDAAKRLVHVQPGLPQDRLARFCIAHGWMPLLTL